jgi:amino acid transporter
MAAVPEQGGAGDKGLKEGALGFLSGVVIGVASTAPGYSLAAVLGGIALVAGIGVHAPAILLISFIPMLFIATAFYYLNKADPDCGTTFSWCTRAFGPWVGWIAGWAVLAADIIVMANLADIAGLYSWILVGQDSPSKLAVMTVGVIWMIAMTYICYVGIEASARTQYGLLGMELFTLALFAIVALYKVATMNISGELSPSLEWFNPFGLSQSALAAGVILGIFIYWGWDSTVNVNEESADPTEGPGKAAVVSTVVLLGVYVLVGVAAQAYHGTTFLKANSDDVLSSLGKDVFGSPLDKLLIIAVLTSASASCQTTILPATRSALSMAAKRAAPKTFGTVHEKHLTPSVATIWMGVISVAWYIGLKEISDDVLYDAVAALGMMIAFYYGITGFACPVYFRRELHQRPKPFLLVGVAPVLGGIVLFWALYKSIVDGINPNPADSTIWLSHFSPADVIGIGFFLLGFLLMFAMWFADKTFFRRRPEVAPPGFLDAVAPEPVADAVTM